jgi:hypothetical protein
MKKQFIILFCLSLLLGACGKVKRPQHNIYTKEGEKWVLVEYHDVNDNLVEDFFTAFEFDIPAIQRANYKGRKHGSLLKFIHGNDYDTSSTFFTLPDSSNGGLYSMVFIVDDSKGDKREVYWRIGRSYSVPTWIGEFQLTELSKNRMVLRSNVSNTSSTFSPGERLVFEKQ